MTESQIIMHYLSVCLDLCMVYLQLCNNILYTTHKGHVHEYEAGISVTSTT